MKEQSKRLLQNYHANRWVMQGAFQSLKRIAFGTGQSAAVRKLIDDLSSALKSKYYSDKAKLQPK